MSLVDSLILYEVYLRHMSLSFLCQIYMLYIYLTFEVCVKLISKRSYHRIDKINECFCQIKTKIIYLIFHLINYFILIFTVQLLRLFCK